jgi:hypothetical protein
VLEPAPTHWWWVFSVCSPTRRPAGGPYPAPLSLGTPLTVPALGPFSHRQKNAVRFEVAEVRGSLAVLQVSSRDVAIEPRLRGSAVRR